MELHLAPKEGRKEMLYVMTTKHILFTVILRRTYGKLPFRERERERERDREREREMKPAAATWATLSD